MFHNQYIINNTKRNCSEYKDTLFVVVDLVICWFGYLLLICWFGYLIFFWTMIFSRFSRFTGFLYSRYCLFPSHFFLFSFPPFTSFPRRRESPANNPLNKGMLKQIQHDGEFFRSSLLKNDIKYLYTENLSHVARKFSSFGK